MSTNTELVDRVTNSVVSAIKGTGEIAEAVADTISQPLVPWSR